MLHPSNLGPKGVNLAKVASTRSGAAVQPIVNPWVTLQVKVTTSPGQAACLPSRVEVRVMVARDEERLHNKVE